MSIAPRISNGIFCDTAFPEVYFDTFYLRKQARSAPSSGGRPADGTHGVPALCGRRFALGSGYGQNEHLLIGGGFLTAGGRTPDGQKRLRYSSSICPQASAIHPASPVYRG